MKRRKQSVAPANSTVRPMMSAADPPPPRSVVSTRRRWLFRFMAMVVLPLLALGLSEVVLRLVDYGHPTSFFVRHQINGSAMLVDNTWFGWRFFPPTLARSPSPAEFFEDLVEPGWLK